MGRIVKGIKTLLWVAIGLGLLQLGTAIEVHPQPQPLEVQPQECPQPLEVPQQAEMVPTEREMDELYERWKQGRVSTWEFLLTLPELRYSCPQGYVPTASGTCRLENPGVCCPQGSVPTAQGDCCLDPKTGWKNDLANAEQTLQRSAEVLQDPRLQSTLAYHFALLYNIITYREIALAKSGTLEHPGFLLRFIPIFYKLYDDALQNFLSKKGGYHDLWANHFQYSSFQPEYQHFWAYLPYVEASLVSGVRAHILGDMQHALRAAYQSYTIAYCVNVPLDTFHKDFFEINKAAFLTVRDEFVFDLMSRFFPPNMAIPKPKGWILDKFADIDIDEIYQWRQQAWDNAKVPGQLPR